MALNLVGGRLSSRLPHQTLMNSTPDPATFSTLKRFLINKRCAGNLPPEVSQILEVQCPSLMLICED